MVHAHLKLASRAVARVHPRLPAHVGREDLHAAALLGLVGAARSYNPRLGVPFELYAARRVEGAIIDELRKADWASRGMRRRERLIDEAAGPLAMTLRRAPTTPELAEATGLDASAIDRAHVDRARAALLQLDRLADSGDLERLLPAAPDEPERHVLEREAARQLSRAIEALPARLRRVIVAQFSEGRTGTEVAAEMGVSAARVLQLRREALALLGHALGAPREPAAPNERRAPSARRVAAYRAALGARGARRPVACSA